MCFEAWMIPYFHLPFRSLESRCALKPFLSQKIVAMGEEAIQGRDATGVPGAPWGIIGSPLSPLIPLLKWSQSAQIVLPAPPARPAHEHSPNVYATFTQTTAR